MQIIHEELHERTLILFEPSKDVYILSNFILGER